MVGIGASAGGIDALKAFLPAVKPDCGMAFVLVQHLDPDHKSMLVEILANISHVPVNPIEDGTLVDPNHFYVIPPNATLTIENGRLHLAQPVERRGLRTPIDTFFVSLAQDRGEYAACVILSGTGSDGTLGLRAIKEHGGLTLGQEGAKYDGMMLSALSTGLVDFVLPAEDMPAKLADYFRHMNETDRKKADGLRQDAENSFDQICALLRARTGDDFSGYKETMIVRRAQRRMQVLQVASAAEFLARLRTDPHEVDLLHQDLLIGVTNFFRDPKVFETLERDIIPKLFEGKGPDDSVRVWVPGCSTGEEAYTIAILLREYAPKSHATPKLQIFATDIDEHALEAARAGHYPAAIVKDLPAEILEWHFSRDDGAYRIAGEIRDMCLFSRHNVLRDPPFSKLDLISCRNLLIYLNPEMQNRLIPIFHYALLDRGYLLLGSSENVTRHSQLFSIANRQSRIFKLKPQTVRRPLDFPLSTPATSNLKPSQSITLTSSRDRPQDLAERWLLGRYAPAYVVITAEGDVLHSSARTGKYLELPPGPPSNNIFSMARPGLRLDLRAAVHTAIGKGQTIVQSNVSVGADGGEQRINLIVQPLQRTEEAEPLCMIAFEDIGGLEPLMDLEHAETVADVEGASVRQLEADLRATRDRLQTTTEELESSNEELKSGNEELLSVNEELQSSQGNRFRLTPRFGGSGFRDNLG